MSMAGCNGEDRMCKGQTLGPGVPLCRPEKRKREAESPRGWLVAPVDAWETLRGPIACLVPRRPDGSPDWQAQSPEPARVPDRICTE